MTTYTKCPHGHPTEERPHEWRSAEGENSTTTHARGCRLCGDRVLSGPHVLYPFRPPPERVLLVVAVEWA